MNDLDPLDLVVAERTRKKSVRRLPGLIKRSLKAVRSASPRAFAAVLVLHFVNAAALAGQVLAVRLLLEQILSVSDASESTAAALLPSVALLALLTVITSIATSLQGGLNRFIGESLTRIVWRDVLAIATQVSLRHFESAEFYDRLQRVQANAFSRPHQVAQGVIAMVSAVVAAAAVAISLVNLSPALLPLLLLGGIPLLLSSRRESRLEFDFNVAQTPAARLRAYLSLIQTSRGEAKEVRAFDLAPALRARLDALYAAFLGDLRRHLRKRAGLALAGSVGSALFLVAALMLLVLLIARGEVDVATAGASIVALRILQAQVQAFLGGTARVFESSLFLDDVEEFLALGPSSAGEESGAEPPADFSSIEVEDVEFSYPGSPSRALAGVSLRLRRGEVIALVGENGSGKTTLAKVLAGLYDADRGHVRWDGVDVRSYRRAAVRSSVAVVFQDFVQFALTARENIAVGRPDAPEDPDRVERAARAAGADSFIRDLPQGYETVLSRLWAGGHDLSGGQWQRVALARALYRAAPLVILDEPTASLDPRAEQHLFQSLRGLLVGRTGVLISHRFSSVRSADRIYVLAQGRVIESGSHDELVAAGGHYAELFALQAAAYLPDDVGAQAPSA